MEFDIYEYNVCGHYASAIINGDYSGLTDEEAEQLNSWINNEVPAGAGHFDGFSEDDATGFSRDEVTGLMADCFKVRWHRPIKQS